MQFSVIDRLIDLRRRFFLSNTCILKYMKAENSVQCWPESQVDNKTKSNVK